MVGLLTDRSSARIDGNLVAIMGNMPLSGMRTDGEQTLRRVGHSSPDLCRVKKEKIILNS